MGNKSRYISLLFVLREIRRTFSRSLNSRYYRDFVRASSNRIDSKILIFETRLKETLTKNIRLLEILFEILLSLIILIRIFLLINFCQALVLLPPS